MFKFLLIFIFSFSAYSQNYGDESDGSCTLSGGPLKTQWNCTDVIVSGTPTFNSSASGIIIRATGDVTINGTLSASASSAISVHSQTSSLGGGPGGLCTSDPCPTTETNASGSLGGEGRGGLSGNDINFDGSCGGGGGSGGTYNNIALGTAGMDGTTVGTGTPGAGGLQVSSSYGSESSFATIIQGGVGAGAGGSGDDSTAYSVGGAGGAGGGVIQIFAKGTIINNGTIKSDGAKGNIGSTNGGGSGGSGGGGSGGTIFIYTATTFSNLNIISAQGGQSTAGSGNGGAGGAGGVGRIRIDTATGAFTNTGSVNPAPQVFIASELPSAVETFTSDIEYNCAFSVSDYMQFIISFILGLSLLVFPSSLLRKFIQQLQVKSN